MKKGIKFSVVGLLMLFSFLIIIGCPKKTVFKEEAAVKEQPVKETVVKPQQPIEPVKEVKPKTTPEKEKPLTEAAAREAAAATIASKEKAEVKMETIFPDINFDFDKFDLKPEARNILKKVADALMANKKLEILIEGHCDERGTHEYNLALGERRANEARKFLIELGVEQNRIKTISYGEEMPLDPNNNEEAWAKNRRAHFVISLKN